MGCVIIKKIMNSRNFLVMLLAVAATSALAQEAPLGTLYTFVGANDRFGAKLLKEAHSSAPGQNVAVSPLPISFVFALLREASVDSTTLDEMQSTFEWSGIRDFETPSRMLLARLDPPRRRPAPPRLPDGSPAPKLLDIESPEELWLSTAFSYRGKGAISKLFAGIGKQNFGVEFQALPENEPPRTGDSHPPNPVGVPREASTPNTDFWIASTTHLQTVWADNAFSMGTKKDDHFILSNGQSELLQMLVTEKSYYRHVSTKDFEAIDLVCQEAYLQLVLPANGTDLNDLEAKLAQDSGSLGSALQPQIGDVELPRFNFKFDADVRKALERMGLRRVFQTTDSLTGLLDGPGGARLKGISQKVEIEVNEQGIRANARTVSSGVYGGIMSIPEVPFHMVVNRPFLFFIRDNVTDALLFAGAVVDPAKH